MEGDGIQACLLREEIHSNVEGAMSKHSSKETHWTMDNVVKWALAKHAKFREELLMVKGMKRVLKREKWAIWEKVRRATGLVWEWVAHEQRRQLLDQAELHSDGRG